MTDEGTDPSTIPAPRGSPAATLALLLAGGLAAALGLTVLVGWHTHKNLLLQIRPTWIAMVYNSALSFLLSGVALIAIALGRPRMAPFCGAVAGLFGLLNVVEYLIGVDLGLDRLLMEPYNSVGTAYPGRMAPPTAVCFTLTGAALIVAGIRRGSRYRPLLLGLAGSMITAIGAVGLGGYLVGMKTLDWGRLVPMAAHTAIGFSVLGLGILAAAWRAGRARGADAQRWLPVPVGVGAAAATLCFWQSLIAQGQAKVEAVMVVGLLMSVVLAWAVHLTQTARLRAREAEGSNDRLTREMAERAHAEETLRATSDDLRRTLDAVAEAVAQLAAGTTEILACTNNQAESTRAQATAVLETAASVTQVAQSAEQAAERARRVGDSVRKTVEIGRTGRAAVDDSAQAMSVARVQVDATAAAILSLAEQAMTIGEIISTVKILAEQTNLLSLNAAIEASRAGEHGKGFAVVASEVKSLADQSRTATVQIRTILGEIQQAANDAVISAQEANREMAAAIKVGGQASETIKILAATLIETAEAAAQIVASTNQQALGMAQISEAMKSIDGLARKNVGAIREVEQAARDLTMLSNRLSGITARAGL